MRNVQIDYRGEPLTFESASLLAKGVARENQMKDPTIMAWHMHKDMIPYYDGADPDTWWAKYGEGNGGRLEICVGDEYQFVMMDARGYDILGSDNTLRNLEDSEGNPYLCYTAMMGRASMVPNDVACIPLDEWTANQY